MLKQFAISAIPLLRGGHSKQRFTNQRIVQDLSDMVTPTPPTSPHWSAARRCASPKRERLIVLFAKLTESDSARLKSWGHFPDHAKPLRHRTRTGVIVRTDRVMVNRDCGTNCACGSVSTTSIRP